MEWVLGLNGPDGDIAVGLRKGPGAFTPASAPQGWLLVFCISLLYAISLRLPCGMNKIKKKKTSQHKNSTKNS